MLIKKLAVRAAIILGMAAIIVWQHSTIQKIQKERDNYQQNTIGMLEGIKVLRQDSTKQAYQIQALTLKKKEYQQYREQDAEEIKSLKLKLKRISSVSTQKLEVRVPVFVPIVQEDNQKVVKLVNKHISFTGIITKDSLNADISIPVTLKQMVYKIPKRKFLWWSWGCKGFNQVIITDNPYIKLNYAEYINIK